MKIVPKPFSLRFALTMAAGLATALSSHAQSATATISDVAAGGGVFDYTITLDNNGSAALEDFWYGWTTSGNNLPNGPGQDPSTAGNSLGWANGLDGNSIQWEGSSGDALGAGQTATFTFASTATPTEIETSPSGESVAYQHGIDFSQGSSGSSTAVFSPTPVAAPEPSSWGLFLGGLFVMGLTTFKSVGSSRRLQ